MALETVSQKFGLIFGSLEEPVSGPSISAKWTWTIIGLSRNRVRLDLAALTVEPKLAEKFQLLLDLTRGMLFLRQNLARQERRLKTGDVKGFMSRPNVKAAEDHPNDCITVRLYFRDCYTRCTV